MRQCTKCLESKPVIEFHRNEARRDGLQLRCKVCVSEYAAHYYKNNGEKMRSASRAYYRDNIDRKRFISARWRKNNPERAKLLVRRATLRRKYGLDVEQYAALFAWSNGGCAICGASERLQVDHDHATGTIRGLLCIPCNTSLGGFRDNIALLRVAIAYLEYSK